MSKIGYGIARSLFAIENFAPRLKSLSQKLASLISSSVSKDLSNLRQWSLVSSSTSAGSGAGRKNCWEFSSCCKETHGRFAGVLGVCPAALESRLDGIHGGRNGGRACWVVSGTHCLGKVQETYEQKKNTCSQCGFYQSVKWEESVSFIQSDELLLKFLR